MLVNRPDAKTLLEILDFHPPDWRRYYRELFDRFPNLASRWINTNLWNMPERSPADQWAVDDHIRMVQAADARQHADERMLAEIRALALAPFCPRIRGPRHKAPQRASSPPGAVMGCRMAVVSLFPERGRRSG